MRVWHPGQNVRSTQVRMRFTPYSDFIATSHPAFVAGWGGLAVLPIKEVPHIVEFTIDDLTVTLEGLTGAFLFACITTFRMSSIVETPTGMELLLHFALLSAIIPLPPFFFICVP